ncbi:hypothetical protein D0962_18065 [Leptolyngbyaceae cyanobacterium CCMR0082]|uniref:ATP-binding protein n=1 Tax=Adonisia turfae CCMR0082 TaxID=2304604 RepID=A0A6M0S8D5_9CYAN|nr:ATP-binding protein [Adonisia turfae]NEZ64670.1 hypothetical protein [Adonisia turfae CCMR0082]
MTEYLTIQPLKSSALDEAIAQECIPILKSTLKKAGEYHRLRVTDLPSSIIKRLCEELSSSEQWVVKSLCSSKPSESFEASATKLIELRNTEPKPLLVFLPAGLRTAAEDSLDIATFQQVQLNSISEKIVPRLLAQLPNPLRQSIIEMLNLLRERRVIRDEDIVVRYLLTVIENGASPEAAGGTIFVFGLVPDYQLFNKADKLNEWVSRNENVVEKLTDLRRPLQERISKLKLQAGTIQSRLFSYLRDRMVGIEDTWASEIAINPNWHSLSFDEWPFEDAGTADQVRLVLEPLSLPRQVPDQFSQTVSLPLCDLDSNSKIKVSFRSIPGPKEVIAWQSYRFQILAPSEDAPILLWESNNIAKPKARAKINRTIKASDLRDILEEGTYFLRIEAYGADGAILTKTQPIDSSDPDGRKENESENFLVVYGGAVVDPPEQPRAIFSNSLMDCYFALLSKALFSSSKRETQIQHDSLFGRWDSPAGASIRSDVNFELLTAAAAGYTIRVPGALRKVELTILKNPRCIDNIVLDLTNASSPADITVDKPSNDICVIPTFENFLQARQSVFDAILNQAQIRQEEQDNEYTAGIVETCDLLALECLICDYVDAYIKVSNEIAKDTDEKKKANTIEKLAALDTVTLHWAKKHGIPSRGLLVGPTHPLRLLWHLQHAKYRQSIVDDIENSLVESPDPARLLKLIEASFLPINLPLVIFNRRGKSYIEQDLLTPFWSLFLPANYESKHYDISFVRMQVRDLLGIRRYLPNLGGIEPGSIAYRIFEYIQRHPYIEQLKINVFNPGDGDRVAQALREIEKLRRGLPIGTAQALPEMRYAIHLLTSTEQLNRSGQALDALLDPEKQVAEDDEFTIGSTSLLQPKLLISRSTQEEFLRHPQDFVAHVTILLEQFPVDGRLGDITRFSRSSFISGLVQESNTQLETASSTFGWIRGIRVESPTSSADQIEDKLLQAFQTSQRLQAGLAGSKNFSNLPVVALRLDQIDQGLIRAIHDISDQVLIIDRNLGLDYFDSSSSSQEIGYLLDFSPSYVRGDGERLLLTTKCTEELVSLVRPAIELSGIQLPTGQEISVLEVLRSIAGKLALRLFKGTNATKEIIGLLFARLLLEQAELLQERFIVPIDSHQDWFIPTDTSSSRSRADLLLVAANPSTKTIDITVVEVKLRSQLTTSSRTQLYREMREQAENTIRQFRKKFDPEILPRPRADFGICCKELFSLLNFYIERALRYGLLSQEEVSRIMPFISSLEDGYNLSFRKRGIVCSQDTVGNHLDEDELDFPVHRFGLDTANLLVEALRVYEPPSDTDSKDRQDEQSSEISVTSSTQSISDVTVNSLRSFFEAPIERRSSSGSLEDITNDDSADESLTPNELVPPPEPDDNQNPDISTTPENSITENTSFQAEESLSDVSYSTESDASVDEETTEPQTPSEVIVPEILLGSSELTPQYGLLGKNANAKVAIDLTGCNTISLFGVQGFGKSYTLGVISEMGAQEMPGINALSNPLATVFFHYHKSDTYEPEFLDAVNPNNKQREIDKLLAEYQAHPAGLRDVLILVPEGKLEQRRQEYPNIEIQPIKFSSAELGADSWKFLLGAFGNDSFYIRQIVSIMRRYRNRLTLDALRQEIAEADLTPAIRRLAEDRIALAEPYIDDSVDLRSLLHPGRTIIVDLRDEWLEKEDALGLFVVIMQTFAQAKFLGKDFNKLMVFDEAHKYITESELISQVVEIIREMRHQATSVVIASQDPLSVPRSVIELTSLLVLHRMTSPQWLKHLKSAISALSTLSEPQIASLVPGEALVWVQRSTDRRFTQKPQKVHIRPRVTRHGGGTKTAVEGATLR